ncbi:hypothetical protein VIN7_5739 [Saccharomyces cerevisiae x Saccharomyces kudriavzevii VIN7]|uniref:Uncharacterized protein n=1 Tax=Saccharomyces cerevisiae x Saccharomyces kudriavzevii (strain VIN7) TaxID=1095631 RepID=H0GRL0_SACCK|nr:hypothetical protein VIN7_5739 [Saccharomyces cerevisiae x Saccharomyces kudriavzevii VIN7]
MAPENDVPLLCMRWLLEAFRCLEIPIFTFPFFLFLLFSFATLCFTSLTWCRKKHQAHLIKKKTQPIELVSLSVRMGLRHLAGHIRICFKPTPLSTLHNKFRETNRPQVTQVQTHSSSSSCVCFAVHLFGFSKLFLLANMQEKLNLQARFFTLFSSVRKGHVCSKLLVQKRQFYRSFGSAVTSEL